MTGPAVNVVESTPERCDYEDWLWTPFRTYGCVMQQTGEHRIAVVQLQRVQRYSEMNEWRLNPRGVEFVADARAGWSRLRWPIQDTYVASQSAGSSGTDWIALWHVPARDLMQIGSWNEQSPICRHSFGADAIGTPVHGIIKQGSRWLTETGHLMRLAQICYWRQAGTRRQTLRWCGRYPNLSNCDFDIVL